MMRLVVRNWAWKLFSLALAFLLWLTFSGARELTTAVTVAVQYRNIPKHLEISSDLVEEAHLVLRGPSTRLSRLKGNDMPLIIDLADVKGVGQRTYTIDRRNIALPPSVILERSIPAQIRLAFEERIARRVPVLVRFENIPQGKVVEGFVVEPPALELFGPRSSVAKIEKVEADPIDLSNANTDGEFTTTAFAGDQRVNFVSAPVLRVRVRLTASTPNK
jgi:YbbR domain-containing protein